VEEGGLLDDTIDKHFSSSSISAKFKPLIYEIASGVFRRRSYLEWLLAGFAKHPLEEEIRHLLWMSLYQVLFMRKGAHHVVSEAVDHAKARRGQGAANLVNAVLRRSLREKDVVSLPDEPLSRLAIEYSFPHWLIGRWQHRFGTDRVRSLLAFLNEPPDFTLRVDLRRISLKSVADNFKKLGISANAGRFLSSAVIVDRIGPVLESDLFTQGFVHVQDESSQMAGYAASLGKPQVILDACAGQGTKTTQLRQLLPDATIIAMDINRRKLHRIQGADHVIMGDVLNCPFPQGFFDSILLDAPCSSLGIIRKHPEIRWRRNEKDLLRFGKLQEKMIKSLSPHLKKGGTLVYSVCSFEPEETSDIIDQVCRDGLFTKEPPLPDLMKDNFFLSIPHKSGMDGFFIARLIKT
jgi:16S rRNA (cytosine967-C5)-methyltransferase